MLLEDRKFSKELRRLQKAMADIQADFDSEAEKARNAKDYESEQAAASQYFFERDMIDSDIQWLQHRYLVRQAERLLLPVPEFNTKGEDWVRSEHDGRWRLNKEILASLSKEVRRERRERMEFFFLLPSALIGLVGGLLGVAAFVLTYVVR